MDEKETANTSRPVPSMAIEERNRMIGRHAARHLLAFAFLNSETNGERASLIKLKSLLLMIRNMELIHHWFEDGEADAHGQRQVKGVDLRRIVTTSYDFFLGRGHSIQQEVRRHHTSDLALEGMMKIWQDSKASSPEMKFLCREETIRDLVTYLEKHPSLEGLLSSETDVIKTTFNYLNEVNEGIHSGNLRSRISKMGSRLGDMVRQPWYKSFNPTSPKGHGVEIGYIPISGQEEV